MNLNSKYMQGKNICEILSMLDENNFLIIFLLILLAWEIPTFGSILGTDANVYDMANSNSDRETSVRHVKNHMSRAVTYGTVLRSDNSWVMRASSDVTMSVTRPGTANGSIQKDTNDM